MILISIPVLRWVKSGLLLQNNFLLYFGKTQQVQIYAWFCISDLGSILLRLGIVVNFTSHKKYPFDIWTTVDNLCSGVFLFTLVWHLFCCCFCTFCILFLFGVLLISLSFIQFVSLFFILLFLCYVHYYLSLLRPAVH